MRSKKKILMLLGIFLAVLASISFVYAKTNEKLVYQMGCGSADQDYFTTVCTSSPFLIKEGSILKIQQGASINGVCGIIRLCRTALCEQQHSTYYYLTNSITRPEVCMNVYANWSVDVWAWNAYPQGSTKTRNMSWFNMKGGIYQFSLQVMGTSDVYPTVTSIYLYPPTQCATSCSDEGMDIYPQWNTDGGPMTPHEPHDDTCDGNNFDSYTCLPGEERTCLDSAETGLSGGVHHRRIVCRAAKSCGTWDNTAPYANCSGTIDCGNCSSGYFCSAGKCVVACECTSGPCCDGCHYKSSATICRASAGPCDVEEKCTGTSATCPTDTFKSSGTSCGTKDCDYLDTTCRNYNDKTLYCTGSSATCPDTTCDSYTNTAAGTSCGTCKTCNGAGACSSTPADDSGCGVIDCDGKNYYFESGADSPTGTNYCMLRDYADITSGRCEGFGDCKDANSADCTAYSDSTQATAGICKYIDGCSGSTPGTVKNYAAGTSCGTGKECDGAGNCIAVADTTPPAITIVSPLNQTYATTTISFNVTLNEAGSWCGYSLDGAANKSMTALSATSFGAVNVSMTQGSHNVRFSCNDTVGNRNSTTARYFTIDSIAPLPHLKSPANNTLTYQAAQTFSCNITDNVQIKNLTLYVWNSTALIKTNTTALTGTSNSTSYAYTLPSQGIFRWNCLGYDAAGNLAWSLEKNYTLNYTTAPDTTPPVVHLKSPANNTITSQAAQTFNCNITDNVQIKNLTLYVWNSTALIKTNTTALTGTFNQTSYAYTLPSQGIFRWNCLGYDAAGNLAWSVEKNYTLNYTTAPDTTPPAINITSIGDDLTAPYSTPDDTPLAVIVTNEDADCRASVDGDENYDQMSDDVNCSKAIFFDDFEAGLGNWSSSTGWSITKAEKVSGSYSATASGAPYSLIKNINNSAAIFEARVRFKEINQNHYPYIPTDNLGRSNYWLCTCPNGHFCYYDGSSYKNYPVDKIYSADTWYKVKLQFDYSVKKYWVWVDDVLLTPDGLETKNDQGSTAASYLINIRHLNTASGQTGTMWVDDSKSTALMHNCQFGALSGTLDMYFACNDTAGNKNTAANNAQASVEIQKIVNLTKVYWANMLGQQISNADNADTVMLVAEGTNLEGKNISFEMWRDTRFGGIRGPEFSAIATAEKATTTWETHARDENYYFYFKAKVVDTGQELKSDIITISPTENNSAPVAIITEPQNAQIFQMNASNISVVDFKQASYDVDDNIAEWRWSFGDGSNVTLTSDGNTTHAYNTSGPMHVILIVKDGRGASDLKSIDGRDISINNIFKNDAPLAIISEPEHSRLFIGVNITFNATLSRDTDSESEPYYTKFDNLLFNWTFDEGAPYSARGMAGAYFTRKFTTAGTHWAILTVSDEQ